MGRAEQSGRIPPAPPGPVRTALYGLWLRGLSMPASRRYALGIGAAVVASLVRISLNPWWGTNLPYIFYFPTTLFTALFAGGGPAWLGMAVCGFMTLVWVLPPVSVLSVTDHVDLVGLMVYVFVDGMVAWVGGAHRTLIAERERQREALAEREASLARAEVAARRLAAIVESSDDAIIAKTLDGVITAWNSSASRMFGYSEAEVVGESVDLFIPVDRRDEEAALRRRIAAGDAISSFDTVRLHKNGEEIDVSISVSPIRDTRGVVIGTSTIARDVRVRKREEAERAALLAEAEATRAEAEAANQAKDDFLAVLSHELRTPLASIVTGVRLLRDVGRDEEKARRAREVIERQASLLSAMVEDLLDVKRIVSRTIVLDRRPCDLADVVAQCMASLRETGRFKEHTVTLDVTPVQVLGDPVRLNQVLMNLVGNAVKFTPPGGSIHVAVTHEGPEAVTRVADTGIGIGADALSRIFDLFVQGEPAPGRVRSGLGVGLAVVRDLVELHGGLVQASSEGLGRGSMFVVRLPAAVPPQPAGEACEEA